MTDKVCPMYKAALLGYIGPLAEINNDHRNIKCDGAECGWWVEEKKCLRISGVNPIGCLGGENIGRLP